jgi:hypothetical protein
MSFRVMRSFFLPDQTRNASRFPRPDLPAGVPPVAASSRQPRSRPARRLLSAWRRSIPCPRCLAVLQTKIFLDGRRRRDAQEALDLGEASRTMEQILEAEGRAGQALQRTSTSGRASRTGIATHVNQGRLTIASITNSFAKKRFSAASMAYSAQISLPFKPTFLTSTVPHVRG